MKSIESESTHPPKAARAWIRPGTPALVLAPMEGVTDAPMRAFLSERGGFSFCVSEFLRVSQESPPAKVFRKHIPELKEGCRTRAGLPVQIQLLGGDPEKLAEAALVAVNAGACGIDLNFGCPAPTVNRHDGGATLLKFPDRIRTIVEAVRRAVPRELPVSAKLRLGWDDIEAVHLNAYRAAEGGADWITIHGRTRLQGYTPPAYWEPIGRVVRRLGIPVVANGEIFTIEDFRKCREQTGAEHFMIGRGALADPSLQWMIASELGISAAAPADARSTGTEMSAWAPLIERFAEISLPYAPENSYVARRIKQWVKMAHLRRPIEWFDGLKRLETLDEVLGFLQLPIPLGSGAQGFERIEAGR